MKSHQILRSFFITLSASKVARRLIMGFPLSRRVARRFVAGETLPEAVAAIRRLNQRGLLATFDLLGENVTNADEARAVVADYVQILDTIDREHLHSNVSLKLTQLGLDLDTNLCLENLRKILSHARELGNFVRIDMESSAHTQRTLDVYYRLRDDGFDNVGVVIQSYLYRSADDVRRLVERGARVRLCKGAYNEAPEVAYPRKADVDAQYRALLEMMWSPEALDKGTIAALATHDENIIRWAKDEADRRAVGKDRFEFQMLYGVRRERQVQLANEGYHFRVYVPYGTQWYPYFMRRLAERPANVIFLARNLFRD